MASTLHHLADIRRNHGTGAALKWIADRLARRLLGASMVRVIWLEAERLPEWVRPDASLDFRFLEPEEVRYFAGDPVYELEAAMAEQIEAGSDLCFGALAEGRLAAYGW